MYGNTCREKLNNVALVPDFHLLKIQNSADFNYTLMP